MRSLHRLLALSLLLVILTPLVTRGEEKSVRPGINDPFKNPDLKKFQATFETESREIFARRERIVDACKLTPGMAVADVGAGTGLFTRLLAGRIGAAGHVYAVDIARTFLDHIEKTCKDAGLSNVSTVLCTPISAELPPHSIDLAFVCDTYHHFEFPARTLQSLHRALKPGGKLIVIDFHRIPGKSSEWTLNHVRAGQEVFTREIESSGFKQVEEVPLLKDNYFLRFARLESAEDKADQPKTTFTYKHSKQADLKMQMHYPKDWKPTDKRPAIVFFFGGGWTNGTTAQFENQAAYLATRGMVAARADYRVKSRQDVTPADCVEDAKSAVRWLRKNATTLGIDPDRIVAAGGSAGGHIAACTALTDGLEAADEDKSISSKPNLLVLFNPVVRFEGVPELTKRISEDTKLARMLSPTLHLSAKTPPALLLFGKNDRLLPQAEEYVAKAKEQGCRAELFLADGVGHGFFNRPPWRERTLKRVDEFLASVGYVTGPPTVEVR